MYLFCFFFSQRLEEKIQDEWGLPKSSVVGASWRRPLFSCGLQPAADDNDIFFIMHSKCILLYMLFSNKY